MSRGRKQPRPGDDRDPKERDNNGKDAKEIKKGNSTANEKGEEEEAESPFGHVIEIPIEDSIDLHLFTPREVKPVVLEYLEQAAAKGYTEIRIIHGRGKGERRRQVHDLLRDHPLVAGFREAPIPRGGWGATIVFLRPSTVA